MNIKALLDKRAGFIQQRKSALDEILKADRALTDEERAEDQRLQAEITRMDELIAMARSIPENGGQQPPEPQPTGEGFRNVGEFVYAVRFNPQDPRLRALADGKEHRDMSMGVGATGGFMVPDQFGAALRPIEGGGASIRPRAMVVPAGTPPDAAIEFPALDQSGARGRYGGVQVVWIAEGGAKPQTEPDMRMVKLEPREVAAHVVINDKLLRNWAAAGPFLSNLLRRAITGSEEQTFLNGAGGFQPWGIIGHPAAINVARAGAGAIAYADVVNMFAALMAETNPVWLASQTILPQLMNMATPLGQLVWQPNAREGMPMSLLGFPLIINPRSPVLGAQGDLILADLSYYLIKDGSPLSVAASEHPLFVQNKTIVKAFWNVDGAPALNGPLLLEDGVTQVSPFVVLQ